MDGSLIAWFSEHAAPFAVGVAAIVGWALYRHSDQCRQSRKDLYDAIKENTKAVGGLGERISALEAVSNLEILQRTRGDG